MHQSEADESSSLMLREARTVMFSHCGVWDSDRLGMKLGLGPTFNLGSSVQTLRTGMSRGYCGEDQHENAPVVCFPGVD